MRSTFSFATRGLTLTIDNDETSFDLGLLAGAAHSIGLAGVEMHLEQIHAVREFCPFIVGKLAVLAAANG